MLLLGPKDKAMLESTLSAFLFLNDCSGVCFTEGLERRGERQRWKEEERGRDERRGERQRWKEEERGRDERRGERQRKKSFCTTENKMAIKLLAIHLDVTPSHMPRW
ncbi:hypothetical protein BgiMline_007827 [Biomphalaria glabrata]|nr:hypothetical protein BgiMline_018522 [Biomphalaria glabrata]KAI8788495.1 hypothetical protein BgiBS90_011163 [Biomphalaria glabrata]